MLRGASKYAAERLVSGLGTTTSSFRLEAVQQLRIFQPAAALFKQLQILAAATNQLAKKIQLSTRKISSIYSWARTSPIMAYSGPVIDVRVSPTIFSFHSIHHFWIHLKVTELNRVESRTLPKQRLHQNEFSSIEGFNIAS